MKNLILNSQDKKKVKINSEEVRNMIEGFNSVQEVRDFSKKMNEDIFGYNVLLDSSFVEEVLEDEVDDFKYGYDEEEIQTALYEQAEYICDALVDNLKEYVENRYGIEKFESAYDIHNASIEDGINFTLTLSFGKIKHGKLYDLASHAGINDSSFY